MPSRLYHLIVIITIIIGFSAHIHFSPIKKIINPSLFLPSSLSALLFSHFLSSCIFTPLPSTPFPLLSFSVLSNLFFSLHSFLNYPSSSLFPPTPPLRYLFKHSSCLSSPTLLSLLLLLFVLISTFLLPIFQFFPFFLLPTHPPSSLLFPILPVSLLPLPTPSRYYFFHLSSSSSSRLSSSPSLLPTPPLRFFLTLLPVSLLFPHSLPQLLMLWSS